MIAKDDQQKVWCRSERLVVLKLTDHHFATRNGYLPPVNEEIMLDYAVGSNGAFARGRRPGIEVCMPISTHRMRGVKPVQSYVQWGYPKVPAEMLALVFAVSRKVAVNDPREALFHLTFSPIEPAAGSPAHIMCADGWHLEFPEQRATKDEVEPLHKGAGTSEERAVIEVHSHHHEAAYFSEKDDEDEGRMSFRVYGVIGTIFERPAIRMRVGLFGHFFDYAASEFFDMPAGVVDLVEEAQP